MSQRIWPVLSVAREQLQPSRIVGVRFHPTDEELVGYYLKHKITGGEDSEMAIAVVNIYKHEPWELPALSKIFSEDQEWYYFISPREYSDKKKRLFNRKTESGCWKLTGKPRKIKTQKTNKEIGLKRNFVFHSKDGGKTGWVMHEHEYIENSSLPNQEEFVIIKLKKKADEEETSERKGESSEVQIAGGHDSMTHFAWEPQSTSEKSQFDWLEESGFDFQAPALDVDEEGGPGLVFPYPSSMDVCLDYSNLNKEADMKITEIGDWCDKYFDDTKDNTFSPR